MGDATSTLRYVSPAFNAEIARYEVVRQRLRTLLRAQPWIGEITLALEGQLCRQCGRPTVVEHPSNQFRCTACGETWAQSTLKRGR